jgi:hypothetical protein
LRPLAAEKRHAFGRAEHRLAMALFDQVFGRTAGADRAGGEAGQADHPVIHDDRPGNPQIHAELRRNLHHMVAARQHFRRQGTAFASHDVSGLGRVMEGRQIDGLFDQFDSD